MRLKIQWKCKLLGNLVKIQSWIQKSGLGSKFCISLQLPDDTYIVSPMVGKTES